MPSVTADLRKIIGVVQVRSADSFSIFGETFQLPPAERDTGAMASHLSSILYQRMYCRPRQPHTRPDGDRRSARVFVDQLSEANCGKGTWDPGWIVKTLESNGMLVVCKARDDLTVWAHCTQFRASAGPVGVGSEGRLRLDKELREMLPGYYTILGDADQYEDDPAHPTAIVRFYWHLTAEGAPLWVRELTRRFNGAGVPARAKLLNTPGAYNRADAGVLYIAHGDLKPATELLPDLHAAVSSNLRQTAPMFTKRLARGLGVAEDPGGGRSFGQHRCQLVSEGLIRAFESGQTASLDMMASSVHERFVEEKLSIKRPWLNAGSKEQYGWPAARVRA